MNTNKITQMHVYLIGAVVLLIVGVGLFFFLIKPLNEKVATRESTLTGLQSQTVAIDGKNFNYTQVPAAKAQLVEAEKRLSQKAHQLALVEAEKQLPAREAIDLQDGDYKRQLAVTLPRWIELPKVVVTRMERFAQDLAKRRHVKVVTNFQAPASGTDPTRIPTDVITYALGPMSVEGPFPNVMAWMTDWNRAPLLVSVDGLKLQLAGKGGVVQASCTLTAYVFPTHAGNGSASGQPAATAAPAAGTPPPGFSGMMNSGGGGMNSGGMNSGGMNSGGMNSGAKGPIKGAQ